MKTLVISLSKVDGVMFWLGIDSPYALHHPQMNPKEEALAIGVDAVSSFLKRRQQRVEGLSMKSELRKASLTRNEGFTSRAKTVYRPSFQLSTLQRPFQGS